MNDKQLSKEEQKRQLEEIKDFLSMEKDRLKPLFGFMFWQFSASGAVSLPDGLISQGLKLTMNQADDEVQATLLDVYVRLWDSSRDLNAATRFIASALQMSADELLQCRQQWLNHQMSPEGS